MKGKGSVFSDPDIFHQTHVHVIKCGEPCFSIFFDVDILHSSQSHSRPFRCHHKYLLRLSIALLGMGKKTEMESPGELIEEAQFGHPLGISKCRASFVLVFIGGIIITIFTVVEDVPLQGKGGVHHPSVTQSFYGGYLDAGVVGVVARPVGQKPSWRPVSVQGPVLILVGFTLIGERALDGTDVVFRTYGPSGLLIMKNLPTGAMRAAES